MDIGRRNLGSNPNFFTVVGNRVFFEANDDIHGSELWSSDGTTGGTALLLDIQPGEEGSFPQDFATDGRRLYFAATGPEIGSEVWASDGTAGGTRAMTDLWPGVADSRPDMLTVMDEGPWLYFLAWTETTWQEPFRLALPFFDDGFESGDTSAWTSTVP